MKECFFNLYRRYDTSFTQKEADSDFGQELSDSDEFIDTNEFDEIQVSRANSIQKINKQSQDVPITPQKLAALDDPKLNALKSVNNSPSMLILQSGMNL